MNKAPTVSVLLKTYNHFEFIKQALDSVAMQDAPFGIEVIVGDDCSTDGTREIIRAYASELLTSARLVFPNQNLGNYGNDLFKLQLHQARGEFIAILDGDDYWLYDRKLQRQVDFLRSHGECSACFHDAYEASSDGTRTMYLETYGVERRSSYFLPDLVRLNFIPTCSIVARRDSVFPLPSRYATTPLSDWLLNVALATRGRWGYIDEVWGFRRLHSGGMVTGANAIDKLEMQVRSLQAIHEYLYPVEHDALREEIRVWQTTLLRKLVDDREFVRARRQAATCLRAQRYRPAWPSFYALAVLVAGTRFPLLRRALLPVVHTWRRRQQAK